MDAYATPLMTRLIMAGRIPGFDRCNLAIAATLQELTGEPSKVPAPVTYCQGLPGEPGATPPEPCGNQLVQFWFGVVDQGDPEGDVRLVCLWCARRAVTAKLDVHELIIPKTITAEHLFAEEPIRPPVPAHPSDCVCGHEGCQGDEQEEPDDTCRCGHPDCGAC